MLGIGPGMASIGRAACGDDHEQIRLVSECRQRRSDQEAEIVICQRSLRDQDNLAGAVQFMRPGRKRGLIRNDRKGTDEMHRGRDVAWKLETRNRQLHIGICKFYDGVENSHRQRPNAQVL